MSRDNSVRVVALAASLAAIVLAPSSLAAQTALMPEQAVESPGELPVIPVDQRAAELRAVRSCRDGFVVLVGRRAGGRGAVPGVRSRAGASCESRQVCPR